MTQKDLGAEQNKEKKKMKSYGDPKTLVLKWGNHRHRIPISRLCPPASSPEPEPEPVLPPRPSSDASSPALPWNLRDRNIIFRRSKKVVVETTTSTPNKATKEPMLRFAVSLSESEIMEDFLKMTGKMPPSKPKKRVRAIQRNLDEMNFGQDLAKISSVRYHVWDEPLPTTNKKKICHKKQPPN